jgi:ankyrin repeat protein
LADVFKCGYIWRSARTPKSFLSKSSSNQGKQYNFERDLNNIQKLLLSAGAPVNSQTTALQNAPPLVVSSATGCLPFVKLLLEFNADKNAANDLGRTATSFAAENGHVVILEQLHLAGADIFQTDNDGLSPVVHAARAARTECIDFLLSR